MRSRTLGISCYGDAFHSATGAEEGLRRPWRVGSSVAEFPLIAYLGRSASAVRRSGISHIFPVTLFVLEPGLVLQSIGHGGALE